MNKFFLILTFFTSLLWGANSYETSYMQELNIKNLPENVTNILKKDKYYKLAVNLLTNKKFMEDKNIKSGDPHRPNLIKEVTIKVPNFNKAYKTLETSYNTYKNPISSFIIIYLIKTKYGINNKLKDFAKYSKVNYENKLCSGFIDYGETLQKGYYQKVDNKKAKKVYEEGLNQCKTTGWYAAIISSKIMSLK